MIVLDCNAAVAMTLGNPEGTALRGLLLSGEKVITSSLFYAELASALWKYQKSGTMDRKRIRACMDSALSLIDEFHDVSENYLEAESEGARLGHSPYDMFYLTLARRYSATLLSLDRQLVLLCEREGIDCIHLASLEA